ncbi:MAG: hypothetical protein RLZZ272_1773 [Actinomycetota bacterium]
MALTIALAQVACRVGAIEANVDAILAAWRRAADIGADLVVLPELAVTGYPPEDLLLRREFVRADLAAIERLATRGPAGSTAIVGYVAAGSDPEGAAGGSDREQAWDVTAATRRLTNAAAVLRDGRIVASVGKQRLPNYGVFDEARYFAPAPDHPPIDVAGTSVGVVVCEDLWSTTGPAPRLVGAGAEVLVALNASPWHRGKRAEREAWVTRHARELGTAVCYVNLVGGQDELVFDGDSMVADGRGDIVARGAQFDEDLVLVTVEGVSVRPHRAPAPRLDPVAEVWAALVRATRDYCLANGFTDAIVGVSGGIDSAVVTALAVDALGAEHVTGVAMPAPHSSTHSRSDARDLTSALGCRFLEVPIGGMLTAAGAALAGEVVTDPVADAGVAYENLQSRLRGLVLMALSNEHGAIVLTTGNKSEYAVGYATLYGDMAGGFAPLKDVPKLLVYELAHWRNRDGEVIPASTLTKPPSAELRPGQLDQDSLPPYEVLDDLVHGYVELDESIEELVARGHPHALVLEVVTRIDRAEHKRRQAAPGPKVTPRAFGRERRVPISNAWDPRRAR